MAAQLFVFFIAGFETSSSTMSNCLFELALNHKIRDKLRKEINEELSKTGGVITYEGIKKMDYLDKTVNGNFIFKIHIFLYYVYINFSLKQFILINFVLIQKL